MPHKNQATRRLVSAAQAAAQLDVPAARVYAARSAGHLEPVDTVASAGRAGRTALYDLDAVAEAVRRRCPCGADVVDGRLRCDRCLERTRQRRNGRDSRTRPGPGERQAPVVVGRRATTLERFMVKVQLGFDCWNWIGSRNGKGYGLFWDGERLVKAHRWAYEHLGHQGPRVIPPGMQVDHRCRNRSCVNPLHLDVVTARENNRRARLTS